MSSAEPKCLQAVVAVPRLGVEETARAITLSLSSLLFSGAVLVESRKSGLGKWWGQWGAAAVVARQSQASMPQVPGGGGGGCVLLR